MRKSVRERYNEIKDLNLSDSLKEYLLNCDDDGMLTKKDADYLKEIGKYVFLKDLV